MAMARIFLSHSSANNAHGLALAEWQEDHGWSALQGSGHLPRLAGLAGSKFCCGVYPD
jgi:hypothetical protein